MKQARQYGPFSTALDAKLAVDLLTRRERREDAEVTCRLVIEDGCEPCWHPITDLPTDGYALGYGARRRGFRDCFWGGAYE